MSNKTRLNNVSKSPRAFAVDMLVKCNEGAFANEIVPAALSRSDFEPRDRALITRIVYSTLRQQIRIDHVLTRYSKRPLNKIDAAALNALRSIVCQVSDGGDAHGVVNETVKAMPFSTKSFVNGMARTMMDDHKKGSLFIDEIPRIAASMPKWIYDEVLETFDNPEEIFAALNAQPAVTVVSVQGRDLNIPDCERGAIIPEAYLVKSMGDIGEIDAIKNGDALVIDQGSQLVVQCVDSTIEMNVLDVCAAPGGKSFLLSEKAHNVVSIDQTLSRMRKLTETKERVSARNVYPVVADARALPFTQKFDRILVDAPCSGLGVLRRRPDARLRLKSSDVDELVELQKEILSTAISQLSDNGKLIYSVCTFSKRETLEIDEWLQRTYPELIADSLASVNVNVKEHGRGILLTPSQQNDGMFALRLVKA